MKTIKFFYNGFKVNGGKLQKCFYMEGPWINYPNDMITICGREYDNFKDLEDVFTIENNTDITTDYFEPNKIRVVPSHPLYAQVKKAVEAVHERNAKIRAEMQR